jgi:hypothetical protein
MAEIVNCVVAYTFYCMKMLHVYVHYNSDPQNEIRDTSQPDAFIEITYAPVL